MHCSIVPSIYEAVSKVNIFEKRYYPGPTISCPVAVSYHDSICQSKLRTGPWVPFHCQFVLRSSLFLYARLQTGRIIVW